MRLDEMASLIAEKSGLVGEENLSASKEFLTRRHEMIFNDQLWKDSVYLFNVQVNKYGLSVNTDGSLNTGSATAAYASLTPAQQLVAQNAAYGIFLLPNIVDRVLGVRSAAHTMNVIARESLMRMDFDQFNQIGDSTEWFELPAVVISFPQAPAASLNYTNGVETATNNVVMRWTDSRNSQRNATFTLPLTVSTTAFDTIPQLEIRSITKAASQNSVLIGFTSPVTTATALVTLSATDTAATPLQRIQVLPYPMADFTLRVLVKIRCPQFSNDSDTPAIRNMDNVLIAYGMADMWARARQLSKSAQFAQEGTALLGRLIELETVQSGNYQQILPADGFGEVYFGPNSNSLFGSWALP